MVNNPRFVQVLATLGDEHAGRILSRINPAVDAQLVVLGSIAQSTGLLPYGSDMAESADDRRTRDFAIALQPATSFRWVTRLTPLRGGSPGSLMEFRFNTSGRELVPGDGASGLAPKSALLRPLLL